MSARMAAAGVAAVVALTLSGCGGVADAETPAPTVTVTKAATKTVTQDATPQSCLDFIGYAEDFRAIMVDAITAASAIVDGAFNQDEAAIEAGTDDIAAGTDKLESLMPDYNAARDACAASAGGDVS